MGFTKNRCGTKTHLSGISSPLLGGGPGGWAHFNVCLPATSPALKHPLPAHPLLIILDKPFLGSQF